jgi:hypothetical protein
MHDKKVRKIRMIFFYMRSHPSSLAKFKYSLLKKALTPEGLNYLYIKRYS